MAVTGMFREEIVMAMAAAFALGLLLWLLRPQDRASVRNTLLLLAFCGLAELSAPWIAKLGTGTIARVVAEAAIVLSVVVLIRIAGLALFRLLLPLLRLQPAMIVEDLTITGSMLAWGLVWLRMAGVDLGSLVATSAVITAVVAFSMQETLGNILGGVVLQLDESIRVGDWVKIEDVGGKVVEIRWRHTAIETRNRETVIIPNGWLVKNRFMVIGSRSDPRRLWRRWLWFEVDMAHPPAAVCEVLHKSVADAEIPCVAREPAPSAVLMKVEAGIGHYALRYFLSDPMPDDPTDSMVRAHAVAALTRFGMALAIPRQERLLIKDDEDRRAALHAREMARREAALADVELFRTLSDAERSSLAEHLVYAPFVRGDTLTRQGAVAHWLYLVVRGEAEVWLEDAGQRNHVATLAAGSVFGEMGMMTGEPRRATVTARSDVECYRLDKAGFEQVLRSRPDIAGEIAGLLAARQNELSERRDAGGNGRSATRAAEVLARIRGFFGLQA